MAKSPFEIVSAAKCRLTVLERLAEGEEARFERVRRGYYRIGTAGTD
jgi:hypothetical protein